MSLDNPLLQDFNRPAFFTYFSHWSSLALETAGILILLLAALTATIRYLRARQARQPESSEDSFTIYRTNLGRGILLALEFLVAADIIGTVAVDPTWNSVGILAVIVLIRTFLSFALDVEIHGRPPWRGRDKS